MPRRQLRYAEHVERRTHRGGRTVVGDLPEIEARTSAQWRRWLKAHHASSRGVWLVFHKAHTGIPSIPYDDAVNEALSVGWIDSLVRRLDDDRYVRKFTPRKPTSNWSDINRARWKALKAAGRLAPEGLAAAPTGNRYDARPTVPAMPDYFDRALKARPAARRFFQALPPGQRRYFVGWVHLAKREETRQRRLREAMALLAAGKRLGLR